jgi:3-phenylpropionate/trans-cinnamate dioxygenase ferredoxin reductase component
MNNPQSIVIVGGGLAGANAAFALRELGYERRVTVIGEESSLPYERPPMSKEYLRGEKSLEEAFVKPADEYSGKNIELLTGRRAVKLDAGRREITLNDETTLSYDAVLLATGSAPRKLDAPGAELKGVHYLRNVEDAHAIRNAANEAQSVVVIGGGWIGTEVAASLRQLGRNVSLVALPPGPLEHVLGSEVAGVYQRLHKEHGTPIIIGRVAELAGTDRVTEVVLSDGQRLPADLVVAGVGAAARVDLAAGAGLHVHGGGVQVDQFLQTSVPEVFAAGDIASAWHPRFGRHIRIEHWDNAIEQGKVAAANMLGQRQAYDRTPYFYSDQFDLGMEYRGYARSWDRVVIRGDLDAREFDAFWVKDGHVVAAMNANRWDDAAELQELVDNQAPADIEKLANLEKEPVPAG